MTKEFRLLDIAMEQFEAGEAAYKQTIGLLAQKILELCYASTHPDRQERPERGFSIRMVGGGTVAFGFRYRFPNEDVVISEGGSTTIHVGKIDSEAKRLELRNRICALEMEIAGLDNPLDGLLYSDTPLPGEEQPATAAAVAPTEEALPSESPA